MNSLAFCSLEQRDELTCLEVRHPLFEADLLLQGAQLISFRPTQDPDNWLWLSNRVNYKRGVSLRGGIPVCWPWFGNADKNPVSVQQHIAHIDQAPTHGFARTIPWQIKGIKESCHQVNVCLFLPNQDKNQDNQSHWNGNATLEAHFVFSKKSCQVSLITTNTSTAPLSLSQALHTYFPTRDIKATRVYGLEGCQYADALVSDQQGWKRYTQSGPINFAAETDRIYQQKNNRLRLQTPEGITYLTTYGSQSCIVWNPWIEKARRLSQFGPEDYQKMVCIETANALDDVVTLEPGNQHCLTLILSR
ncbi:D-hexose-6-phosphate mutarotase [Bacterioplanoides sp. SCSIO 12839]|uniref:D-hexose-6-phosphate mutarotase n=1 Tax=Bacterioplanoides sp. SCSIO 12839 TaxID=2829569 RepID=UPI00210223A2|nr:D-hexose-6-phosphate mutarotase [Bacterioplanoides sp. SCSIO 12839]UTW47147.1 D-hexose-6-phosphate mutarotase [Bacterioplanoides sp. SCSIO 12839]